jgi:Tol biopolymer transport system component
MTCRGSRYVRSLVGAGLAVSLATATTPVAQADPSTGGATTRVDVAVGGGVPDAYAYSVDLSSDGRLVAFASSAGNLVARDTNGSEDVFVRDRATGVTSRVSVSSLEAQGNGVATSPTISGDGRYVAFVSSASNLVAGDTNRADDVFVRDRLGGTTVRASVRTGGGQATAGADWGTISADGRFVAFSSTSANLVPGDTNGA